MQQCHRAYKKQTLRYQQDLDKVREDIDDIGKPAKQVNAVSGKSEELRDLQVLKDTVLDLKCRSMKNNLVFTGLGGETNTEDTEGKLWDFLFYELEI